MSYRRKISRLVACWVLSYLLLSCLMQRSVHAKAFCSDYLITETILCEYYTPDKIDPPPCTLVFGHAIVKKPKEGSKFDTVYGLYIREWEEKAAEVKVTESADSLLVDINGCTLAGVAASVQGLRDLLEHRGTITSIFIGHDLDVASVELLKEFSSLRYIWYILDGYYPDVEVSSAYRSFLQGSSVVFSNWDSNISNRDPKERIRPSYRLELLVTDGINDFDRIGSAEPVSLRLRIGCKDVKNTLSALERIPTSVRYLTLELWNHYNDWEAIKGGLKQYDRLVSLSVVFCGDKIVGEVGKGAEIGNGKAINLSGLPSLQAVSIDIAYVYTYFGQAYSSITLTGLKYDRWRDNTGPFVHGKLDLDGMTITPSYLYIRRMSVKCTDLHLLKLRELGASNCLFETAQFGTTGKADIQYANIYWGSVFVMGDAAESSDVVFRLLYNTLAINCIDLLARYYPELPPFEHLVEASVDINDSRWTILEEFVRAHLVKVRLFVYFNYSGLSADASSLEVVEQLNTFYFVNRRLPVRTIGTSIRVLHGSEVSFYPFYCPDLSELKGKEVPPEPGKKPEEKQGQ